ncbi:glycosyltransferase [Aquabacterium sp. G14]|uniref:glycosyltransferase family 4 protein n=1 Tax=Aquabacterium sp. G14 TaxID=3130164 RepID=UPI0030B76AD9
MKILLSAFAFSPVWGSEPGVGWCWAIEMAKTHEVTVLTHRYFENHMRELEASMGQLPFEVIYFDVKPIWHQSYERYLNSQLYVLRWQWCARSFVKSLLKTRRFDLIHHLTWGTIRYPSFLQKLGVPLVAGPLGGGERAPFSFYKGVPWRERVREMLRDGLIWSTACDPMIHWTWGRTEVLLCRTRESMAALPWHVRKRCSLVQEIGCPAALSDKELMSMPGAGAPLRLLHVGRLLALKGMHLALPALADITRRGVDWRLTVVGVGPMLKHLQAQAHALGIAGRIDWLGGLPRERVMALYGRHDAFLFPSLHDSGGTVVLESLSQGCPVLCVDLGGPPHFVDATCGAVVPVRSGQPAPVVAGLVEVLTSWAGNRSALYSLRQGALRRARELSWPNRVRGAYELIESALRTS